MRFMLQGFPSVTTWLYTAREATKDVNTDQYRPVTSVASASGAVYGTLAHKVVHHAST